MESTCLSYLAVVLSVVALLLANVIRKRRQHFSTFEKLGIKGPKPCVLLGNVWEIYRKTHTQCQKEWLERYGPVVGYYFGYQPILLVADKGLLKNILLKDFHNFADRGDLLGRNDGGFNGLTHLRGQRWKEVRSTLTPSFTSSKLKQLSPEVALIVDDFIANIDKGHASGEEFELYELYKGLTLETICRSALGVDFGIQKDVANSEVLQQLKLVFMVTSGVLMYVLACFPLLGKIAGQVLSRLRLRLGNAGKDPIGLLNSKCEEIVKLRRNNPENRRVDLLQLMIDAQATSAETNLDALIAGDEAEQHEAEQKTKSAECPVTKLKGLTDKEVTANAFLVLAAGYETTSSSLAFITRVLLRFPEVQEKLREELLDATDKGTVFEFERLQKCQYLESIMQEILRLFPPIHSFTSRYANEEKTYGDLKIPQGMNILAPTKALHYDEEVFSNPTEFLPTRFMPENKTPAMAWAWQPFGAGPRNCIGMRFAQMEIKITLAKLLTKYRLSCASEPQGDIHIAVNEKAALQAIRDPLMVKTELI